MAPSQQSTASAELFSLVQMHTTAALLTAETCTRPQGLTQRMLNITAELAQLLSDGVQLG